MTRTMTARNLAPALVAALALSLPPLLWHAALAREVERQVRLLGSPDAATQAAAHASLASLQPASIPLVIASFADAADAWEPGKPPAGVVPGIDPLTIPVMTWLKTLGGPQVIAALITALDDDDANVRHSSALTLAWLGQDALPALIAMLQEPDGGRRRVAAAWIASFLGPTGASALPALREALDDPDKDLRHTARYAIAEIDAVNDSRARVIDSAKRLGEGK